MLLQAFEKLEELGPKSFSHNKDKKFFKLMQADCQDLPFENDKFDTVVDVLTLQSVYDIESSFSEIQRVCKPGGQILIIARGQSYIPIYNKWLQFKAASDLLEKGLVEHLDFEEFLETKKGLKLIHKERKNLGMTYVYILEV